MLGVVVAVMWIAYKWWTGGHGREHRGALILTSDPSDVVIPIAEMGFAVMAGGIGGCCVEDFKRTTREFTDLANDPEFQCDVCKRYTKVKVLKGLAEPKLELAVDYDSPASLAINDSSSSSDDAGLSSATKRDLLTYLEST